VWGASLEEEAVFEDPCFLWVGADFLGVAPCMKREKTGIQRGSEVHRAAIDTHHRCGFPEQPKKLGKGGLVE
jgi:hypothetical protein